MAGVSKGIGRLTRIQAINACKVLKALLAICRKQLRSNLMPPGRPSCRPYSMDYGNSSFATLPNDAPKGGPSFTTS